MLINNRFYILMDNTTGDCSWDALAAAAITRAIWSARYYEQGIMIHVHPVMEPR